jgi:hypothetical protein
MGRPKGALNKATKVVRELAQKHSKAAIERLAYLAKHAESEQAQVAAAKEILDRAAGKAPQAHIMQGDEEGGPIQTVSRIENVIIDPEE